MFVFCSSSQSMFVWFHICHMSTKLTTLRCKESATQLDVLGIGTCFRVVDACMMLCIVVFSIHKSQWIALLGIFLDAPSVNRFCVARWSQGTSIEYEVVCWHTRPSCEVFSLGLDEEKRSYVWWGTRTHASVKCGQRC